MKYLLTILSLTVFSSTLFADGNTLIVLSKGCVKLESAKFELCTTVSRLEGSAVYGIQINSANSKLEILSNETYDGVESSALTAGLQKVGTEGIDSEMVAFIAGPVVKAMETATSNPNPNSLAKLATIKTRLSKGISN